TGEWTLAEPLERQVLAAQSRLRVQDQSVTTQAQLDLLATLLNSPRSESRAVEALELARKVIKIDPEDPYLIAEMVLAEYRSGHAKDSVAVLNAAIQKDKDVTPRIYFVLAMAQWQAGDKIAAEHNYAIGLQGIKTAAKFDSSDRSIWMEAATLMRKALPH